MNPAVFLDRDGVLIENRDQYVRTWNDVALLPGVLEALALLSQLPVKIVIVTNQSVVGRGIITVDEALTIQNRLVQVIHQAGGRIDGSYMCPHAPPQGCSCRKPLPGLIIQAAAELSIDLSRSAIIGDALSDIQAGQNAGIPLRILVKTGRGEKQSLLPQAQTLKPFLIVNRFADAVDYLIPNLLS